MSDQPVSGPWIGEDVTNMLVSLKKMLYLFPHTHMQVSKKMSEEYNPLDFSRDASDGQRRRELNGQRRRELSGGRRGASSAGLQRREFDGRRQRALSAGRRDASSAGRRRRELKGRRRRELEG
jgi:hypothetical protein